MTTNHSIAKLLAAEIDSVAGSNEEILATVFVDSYLAGGEQRKALFEQVNAGGVSFGGAGFSAILPLILSSLHASAAIIFVVLGSNALNTLVTLFSTVATAADWQRAKQQAAELKSDASPSTLVVSADTLNSFEQIQQSLEDSLRDRPLSDAERMKISLGVLRVLLAHPNESRDLLTHFDGR